MAELARHRLPASDEGPRRARALLAAQLGGFLTVEQGQVAELLISELVTNALRQTQSHVILVDVSADTRIRVSVTDQSSRMPQRQSPRPDEPRGHGLIIDALPGDGKRIWFELPDHR